MFDRLLGEFGGQICPTSQATCSGHACPQDAAQSGYHLRTSRCSIAPPPQSRYSMAKVSLWSSSSG
jgi:hypothetical protein